MLQNCPIFVDDRKEPIHLVRNVLEVWREVTPDIDRLLAVAAPKLGNIRDGRIVQRSQSVFIEKFDALL